MLGVSRDKLSFVAQLLLSLGGNTTTHVATVHTASMSHFSPT